ncbi:MAG: hypothetical protein IMZ51_00730 [Chloroflexi bacterium]|nr:hypothetical protein [Chloroflexota bacterium]MBE3114026.1 hypothetical protein [Actinomycetota bacterium]MCJ7728201.1 hypothetical protein [Actinomycetota bacterium]
MRLFLTGASFINIILYYTAFAYFDNIMTALAGYNLPVGFLNFLRFFIVFILGFMIGFLIAVSTKSRVNMNYFDIRVFLIVGCIPALALILYNTGAVNLVVTKFFNSNSTISELVFYFFSRETVWALWLGISIGASVRLRFGSLKKRFKHQVID